MEEAFMSKKVKKKMICNGTDVEVVFREPIKRIDWTGFPGFGFYAPLNQRKYEKDGVVCEQDVAVRLDNGDTIYTDIYRPVGATNLPCIVGWSPYGKRPHDCPADWHTYGVPKEAISEGTRFEGPDPYYWCHYGYAVANVDPRGCGESDGDMLMYGSNEAKNGYEFIEWLAKQEWCSGKIGMAGNSYLAIMQWYIAAEQPPHLTAIAPWEGLTDVFRELVNEGGIPATGFLNFVFRDCWGHGMVEDLPANGLAHPFINDYWIDKICKFENIKIPVYACAGYSHVHVRGSINAFNKITSKSKWLRMHRDFEWPDQYANENKEDLRKFFDRYLKNIYNGWELTPKVRMDVMDAYDYDYQVKRPEESFPIERTIYKKLFLDANKKSLSFEPSIEHTSAYYDSETEEMCFDMQFNEDTEISGYMKLHLWAEAECHDEMDIFITVQKLDENNAFIPTWVFGERHPGAWGKIRASRRALDEELSTDYMPVQRHTDEEKLKKGEIVQLYIEIYPHSRMWHKGEKLRLRIAGQYIRDPWFEEPSYMTDNKGKHIIHTGRQYDSYLQIPVIPQKYRAGNYVYR